MNETLLALMSALAIYGLATFALPSRGWDTTDEDPGAQLEDLAEAPSTDETRDDESPRA